MEYRYLFKAKRIDNGEWVEGNLIQSCDATDGWETIIIPIKNSNMFTKHIKRGYGNLGFENWYRVDPSTICQCTGLKDKNGKLIWENDIVNATDVHCVCVDGIVVKVNDYKLMLNLYYSDELERVGNKFDNPELLESEGQHGRKEL